MFKKKRNNGRLVVETKGEHLAVFSYAGLGFAARIGDHDIDEIFDIAKSAIKKQMEKENERQTEGEEVRTEKKQHDSDSTKSVDGNAATRRVSRKVHGPKKSDVR